VFFRRLWDKKYVILCLIGAACFILPMVYIIRAAHLAADDFVYGADTHAVYAATGSILETLKEAFPITRWWYNNWQGSYSSMFLMIMQPGIFSVAAYRIGLLLIFVLLIASPVLLGFVINRHYLNMPARCLILMLCSVLFLWTQYLPSVFEGLYWYNSAVYYTFTFSVVMLGITMLILLDRAKSAGLKALWFFLLFIACVLVGGSNYPIALCSACAFAVFVFLMMLRKNRNRRLYLGLFVVFLAAFALNITAPGNALRMSNYSSTHMSLPFVFIGSVGAFGEDFLAWSGKTPLLAFIIMAAAFSPAIVKDAKVRFVHPALAVTLCALLLLSQYVPTMYAISNKGPLRAENIRYMVFVLFTWACTVNAFGWQYQRQGEEKKPVLSKAAAGFLAAVVCMVSLSMVPLAQMWGYKAAMHIVQNNIDRLDSEMNKRIAHILETGEYLREYNQEACINDMLRPEEVMWWNEVDEFYRGEPFTK